MRAPRAAPSWRTSCARGPLARRSARAPCTRHHRAGGAWRPSIHVRAMPSLVTAARGERAVWLAGGAARPGGCAVWHSVQRARREVEVRSGADVARLLEAGNVHRAVAAHNLNDSSSRSCAPRRRPLPRALRPAGRPPACAPARQRRAARAAGTRSARCSWSSGASRARPHRPAATASCAPSCTWWTWPERPAPRPRARPPAQPRPGNALCAPRACHGPCRAPRRPAWQPPAASRVTHVRGHRGLVARGAGCARACAGRPRAEAPSPTLCSHVRARAARRQRAREGNGHVRDAVQRGRADQPRPHGARQRHQRAQRGQPHARAVLGLQANAPAAGAARAQPESLPRHSSQAQPAPLANTTAAALCGQILAAHRSAAGSGACADRALRAGLAGRQQRDAGGGLRVARRRRARAHAQHAACAPPAAPARAPAAPALTPASQALPVRCARCLSDRAVWPLCGVLLEEVLLR